jgi:hypothetical protein
VQAEAKLQREQLVVEVGKAEARIGNLANAFGEQPNSDPANLFAVIWTLALAFDRAYVRVGQYLK